MPAPAAPPAPPVEAEIVPDDLRLLGDFTTDALSGDEARVPSRLPVMAMMAGGLVLMVAAVLLLTQIGERKAQPPDAATAAAAEPAPSAISIAGPGDISLVRQVYEPGHDSGWHAHPGIHAVAVLSGTLTVYDGSCQARTFGPGQPYIGGQELHLARNDTDAPVEMMVTYMSPSAPDAPTQHLPAPAGCGVGNG